MLESLLLLMPLFLESEPSLRLLYQMNEGEEHCWGLTEAFAAFLFRCLLLGIILQEAGWTVEVDARCMQVLWRKARESPCQQWAPTASHPGYSNLVLHQGEESIVNLQNCVMHGLVFQAIAFNGTWLLQIDYMKRSMCSVYGLIYFCQIDTNPHSRVIWGKRTLVEKMHSSNWTIGRFRREFS